MRKWHEMKLNKKLVFAAVAVGVLVPGCVCVSESVHGKPPLTDVEREMCLSSSSGNDLEYWIEGERSTPGCHWHLEHIKCKSDGCLYKCKETEMLWRIAKDGQSIIMEKDVKGTGSNLPLEYHFFSQ